MKNGSSADGITTCNLSDAMDRGGSLGEFTLIGSVNGLVAGRAVTCRTEDGDWRAVVRAIESAGKGDIVVVQSLHGKRRALVGELLAHSARERGVTAFVIDGKARDGTGIRSVGIPVFARGVVANAGNPDGKGSISVTLTINGVRVRPGDTVACDANGVVAIPASGLGIVMARAREIAEKEKGIRKGITEGRSISDLLGW